MFYWLTGLLKITGKSHWIPYLKSIEHQGKPAPVYFPPELIEQGLGLFLTGISNTFALQTRSHWVWPYWAEQQLRPHSRHFIPSGVQVLTVNLNQRNWTSLGVAGQHGEAMIDLSGMITPGPLAPSWQSIIEVEGVKRIPSQLEPEEQHQELAEGWQPKVVNEYPICQGIRWRASAHAFAQNTMGDAREQVWIEWRQEWTNLTDTDKKLTFKVGLRPYHLLGFAPVFQLRQKKNFLRVNRNMGAWFPEEPQRFQVGLAHSRDPFLYQSKRRQRAREESGWLSGVAEFNEVIPAGETRVKTLYLFVPQNDKKLRKRHVQTGALAESALAGEQRWTEPLPLGIHWPNFEWQLTFKALWMHRHAFDDGDYFTPGNFFYHEHWIRDSSFLTMAFDLWGAHKAVAPKAKKWLKSQTLKGDFKSQLGEWDSTGQTLVTWCNHYMMTDNKSEFLKKRSKFLRAIRWIIKSRQRPFSNESPVGLLPAGFSAEHFGANDHYYWDNFWALAGIRRFIKASELFQVTIPWWVSEEEHAYTQTLKRYLHRSSKIHQNILPSSPFRSPDAACIGVVAAVSPLDLQDLSLGWLKPTVEYLMKHWVRENMFYQGIIHTGKNAYLTVQLARALLVLNDRRWYNLLQGILAHGTKTYTWPEAIHPQGGGGCMGDGDHGWVTAEILSLSRLALIREQGDSLRILSGMVLDWIPKVGSPLLLEQAPTSWGNLDLSLTRQGQNRIELNYKLNLHRPEYCPSLLLHTHREADFELYPQFESGYESIEGIQRLENMSGTVVLIFKQQEKIKDVHESEQRMA